MHIHRSAHRRAYTVVSNAALQDNRLSFVARGVLGYLLSRFDGERIDVRKLASLCKTGRQQIANALDELKRYGYYVVERVQDPETGKITTRTSVHEDPQVGPAAGKRDSGDPGNTPTGESTGDEVPPSPVQIVSAERSVPGGLAETVELTTQDGALLRRIARIEPRLTLGVLEAVPLLPLLAQWRERGVPEGALAQMLTAGLPKTVFTPAGFLRSRLSRKLPPKAPSGHRPDVLECENCGRPLAAGRGKCGPCAREGRTPSAPASSVAREGRARVRAALAGV
ncbi:helix-turn-helix domain-containing protein [Streptomyces sp. RKAG293]|uniref:helix-turn-helix domain-containing protein n=1 Tax=Streptomyces sp. RKAG293 TaxID=2893403 RepID=UPI002033BA35|nr:helix-turn-helix domain-containing protein [Streptomyces sp. RKAG293]MCM2420119.1 helix-turn-helix domain-containing protein [Streptomyces sp. RKAG293]